MWRTVTFRAIVVVRQQVCIHLEFEPCMWRGSTVKQYTKWRRNVARCCRGRYQNTYQNK